MKKITIFIIFFCTGFSAHCMEDYDAQERELLNKLHAAQAREREIIAGAKDLRLAQAEEKGLWAGLPEQSSLTITQYVQPTHEKTTWKEWALEYAGLPFVVATVLGVLVGLSR